MKRTFLILSLLADKVRYNKQNTRFALGLRTLGSRSSGEGVSFHNTILRASLQKASDGIILGANSQIKLSVI